jgi:adenine-specific DNA-methyltransferase
VARSTQRREQAARRTTEDPSALAWRLFTDYCSMAPMDERRDLGQFFTPHEVARFMAELAHVPSVPHLRILEPGTGTGVLTASLCERLPGRVGSVHIDVHEIHPRLSDLAEETLSYTHEWLSERGVACTFSVHREDFVIENASYLTPSLFTTAREGYDIAIANPPYFKLLKDDPRARAAAHIVHGQPNIYAIFMAIMASLLREGGEMVTITPRSFTTGDYFRRFREVLFSQVVPAAIHLFGSRTDAFRRDEVLQENVIMRAVRRKPGTGSTVTITTSAGIRDLDDRQTRVVPLLDVVDLDSRELAVHIPINDLDDRILSFVRSWPETLHTLGLKVSTGPVVAFRALDFIHDAPNGNNEVPLLWLQHVKKMAVAWPIEGTNKRQYIADRPDSQYLLLPNTTYVVMRRFSAKEEHRRIVAAPLLRTQFPGRMIGLENHLNYIQRMDSAMSPEEAVGLAGLLNSVIIDRYFRISNGNTQVSAVELRQLPLPSSHTILKVGAALKARNGKSLDLVVAEALNVPDSLMQDVERSADGDT